MAGNGPLPKPEGERVRRNKPTIPTYNLLSSGRPGAAPDCPLELGPDGRAWWEWAWATPQAFGWSDGDLYFLAHRAQLEDDLRCLDSEDFDILDDVLSYSGDSAPAMIGKLINRLKALATGKASLLTRCNDMDDKLGLTPKGMAALRWKIVPDEADASVGAPPGAKRSKRGLSAVPDSATG